MIGVEMMEYSWGMTSMQRRFAHNARKLKVRILARTKTFQRIEDPMLEKLKLFRMQMFERERYWLLKEIPQEPYWNYVRSKQ